MANDKDWTSPKLDKSGVKNAKGTPEPKNPSVGKMAKGQKSDTLSLGEVFKGSKHKTFVNNP